MEHHGDPDRVCVLVKGHPPTGGLARLARWRLDRRALPVQPGPDATQAVLGDLVALYESHAALLEYVARTVPPNWAQDRVTLETAQALHDRLTPGRTHQ